MKRISAPEQTREQLQALIEGRLGTAPDRSSLMLLAARLILEETLEGEVSDRIGRERCDPTRRVLEAAPKLGNMSGRASAARELLAARA